MTTQEEVEEQLSFEAFLAKLKPLIRKMRPIEADYVLEQYYKKEDAAGRNPKRNGWMQEVELFHPRHDLILAAYLKKNPEDTKGKAKK